MPLLSWRVAFLQPPGPTDLSEKPLLEYRNTFSRFDLRENWLSLQNAEASKRKPGFYFFPYFLETQDNTLTCMVLIKEIAEWKRSGNYDKEQIEEKALVILVDPKNAVPWTAPNTDVSWKDLASGKIKPFMDSKNGYIYYLKAWNLSYGRLECPKTYEDWERLCGVPEMPLSGENPQNKNDDTNSPIEPQ
jgi:hypothetical protein